MKSQVKNFESVPLSPNQIKTIPTTLSFHHVSCNVKTQILSCSSPSSIKVLSDLSGFMPPGMNAIIGPTGCGKSTLLDVLAGRKNPSQLTGYVLLNGEFLPNSVRRRLCGYVVQENIVMETLTIRENITFSATLRLPRCTAARERDEKVSSVIEELGLTSVADRIIGTQSTCGVSGGERKRTCIGIELVNDPLVLYLDEPTTGLDSYTAGTVIQTLRRLADSGRTIVFSIHQPKYSIYRLFDRLTIISNGQMIYHGPGGQTPIVYFENCGYFIEGHNNPADFFMDILHGEFDIDETVVQQKNIAGTSEKDVCKTVRETVCRKLIACWLKSTLWRQCKVFLAECSENFHQNRLRRLKQKKQDQKYNSTTTRKTTITRHIQHKQTKFNKQGKQFDCEFIQPGNYLSTINKEIEKFDKLWALSRSLSTTTDSNFDDDHGDSIHYPNVDCLINENTLKKSGQKRNFQQDNLYSAPMNNNNYYYYDKTVNGQKLVNCCSCKCKKQSSKYQQCSTTFCYQLFTLNWRSYLTMKRSGRTILAHFAVQFVIALFLGIIYLNMNKWRGSGIQNRMGLFFLTCLHLLFISGTLLEVFLKDRLIFVHETSTGFYRISAYFLSKILSDVLPIKVIPAFLCLSITYYLTGLRHELYPFLLWQFTIGLLTFSASAITFAVSAMVNDRRIGSILLSMLFVLMMITSGYLVNISTLWKWLQLVRYISILRYAINILTINELFDMTFCPESTLPYSKLSSVDFNRINVSDPPYSNTTSLLINEWKNTEYFHTGIGEIQNLESICISGVQYLESQGIEYRSKWAIWLNELGIFVIAILALCVAYIHLRLIKRYK
uniref:Broad substrate specificity ATP-binding cassette transporter ABCG2 n=2 Tax=Schistosoma mansoni TaxID=6183 RepID=A0A3Q0KL31_SCHMA